MFVGDTVDLEFDSEQWVAPVLFNSDLPPLEENLLQHNEYIEDILQHKMTLKNVI